MHPRAPLCLFVLAAAGLAGCTSAPSPYAATGECVPTVEGAGGAPYANYDEARMAFTRSDKEGSFIATLEDVAWIKWEGDEACVVANHRAYFDQGYTTFEVTLFTKDFTQPTAETFVLTDSKGARLVGKPVSYKGSMAQENERFAARFSVSFRHAVTREVGWVKLARMADGCELEWRFPWALPAEGAGATCAPTMAAASFERPTNLMRARNAAPEPALQESGRPVNLLTHPEAAPHVAATTYPAPTYAPAAFPAPASMDNAHVPHAHVPPTHIPSTAAVGEPAWSEPPAPAGSMDPAYTAQPPVQAPVWSAPPPVAAPPPASGGLPPPVVRGRR